MFLITTTGTTSSVAFVGLGERTFSHPTTDFDLELEYNIYRLTSSSDIQSAIDSGYITVTDGTNPITDLSKFFMPSHVYDSDLDDLIDDALSLGGQTSSYYTDAGNLTGTIPNTVFQNSGLVEDVNGKTGSVTLSTTDISEGTNLYYTDAKARASITIGTNSQSLLTLNPTTGKLDINSLGISDVTVDSTATQSSTYFNDNYTGSEFESGDTVVMTSLTDGTEIWMHNGGTAGTSVDFVQIDSTSGVSDSYIRSLFSGIDGVNYNSSNGEIAVSFNDSGTASNDIWSAYNIQTNINNSHKNNRVLVESITDLPTPIGSTISLVDNTNYELDGIINIGTFSLEMGQETLISGNLPGHDKLIYTGTGNMIYSNKKNFHIDGIQIQCASGSVFNVQDDSITYRYTFSDCEFENINSLGTINGGYITDIDNCSIDLLDNGLNIGSSNQLVHLFLKNSFLNYQRNTGTGSVTMLNFESGSNTSLVKISSNHWHSKNVGDIAINVVAEFTTEISNIIANDFNDFTDSPIVGVGISANNWLFSSNVGISNSRERANKTVIRDVSNLPTPVGGTISLLSNHIYEIEGSVNIGTDVIEMKDGTHLIGFDPHNDKLIYTGTASLLNSLDNNEDVELHNVGFESVNGSVINFNNTTETCDYIILGCVFSNVDTIGTIDGGNQARLFHNRIICIDDGFTFRNTNNLKTAIIGHNYFDHATCSATSSNTIFTFESGYTGDTLKFIGNHFVSKQVGDLAVSCDVANNTINSRTFIANTLDGYNGSGPISGFSVQDREWLFEANTGVPNTSTRSNKTIIRKRQNFPDPVGNRITLLDNHIYEIEGTVDMGTYSIISGDKTHIIGEDINTDILIYSGTSSMFSGTDVNFTVENIRTIATNVGLAKVYDFTNNAKNKLFIVRDTLLYNCDKVGTINGYQTAFINTNSYELCDDGWTINNTSFLPFAQNLFGNTNKGTHLKIESGTFSQIQLYSNHFDVSQADTFGVDINISVIYTGGGILYGNSFTNGTEAEYLQNIGLENEPWIFEANTNIPNSSDKSNTKVIRHVDNLPTPVGNLITLLDDYLYKIDGRIDVGLNEIKFGQNSVILGTEINTDKIIYTGTGSAFISEDTNGLIECVSLSSPNGKLFDFTNTSGNEKTKSFSIKNSLMYDSVELGTFNNLKIFNFSNNIITYSPTGSVSHTAPKGLHFTGTQSGDLLLFDNLIEDTTDYFIKFNSSIFDIAHIDRNQIHVDVGEQGIIGLTGNSNLSSTGTGRISNNNFLDGGTYTSGLDGSRWSYISNGGGVSDAIDILSHSEIWVDTNTAVTTIATASTPVIINCDVFQSEFLFRFTRVNGRITYTGLSKIRVSMDASMYFTSTNNQAVNFYFAKNGTIISKTKGSSVTQGLDELTFSNPKGLIEIESNDYLEVWVENTSSANDLTVVNMNWTVNQ